MKRALIGGSVVIVLAAVGIGIWIYSSLDSIVKAAIEEYLPPMTQTSVSVGQVRLSPSDGGGRISDFVLGNPKVFKRPTRSPQRRSNSSWSLRVWPLTWS